MPESPETILSYCSTFLPEEAVHIYRQVSGIARYVNWVVTRTRIHADRFPYERVHVLTKGKLRFVTRALRLIRNKPAALTRSEIGQMLRFAADKRAVLAHAYLGSEALRVLRFLVRFPGARVVSFHGADLSNRYDKATYTPLWSAVDLVLCRSQSLKALLIERGCAVEKIRLNYTGVPVPETAVTAQAPRISNHTPLQILQACRFIEKKGLDVSLGALKELKQRALPVRLTLAGDGPDRAKLEALANELGVAANVVFTGFLNETELLDLRRRNHIFVHPSRTTTSGNREGIPNALLEAMAWGLPAVATRHSGIPEVIEHGDTGMLVDEATPMALANAILVLAENPALFEKISGNAARLVRTRFSLEICRRNLEGIYDEAISRGPKF